MKLATLRYRFWKWLMLFAYQRMVMKSPQPIPTGVPGHRDPEAQCPAYMPRKKTWEGGLKCRGDGHYLCVECANYEKEAPNE